jgi:hypothetical protein
MVYFGWRWQNRLPLIRAAPAAIASWLRIRYLFDRQLGTRRHSCLKAVVVAGLGDAHAVAEVPFTKAGAHAGWRPAARFVINTTATTVVGTGR